MLSQRNQVQFDNFLVKNDLGFLSKDLLKDHIMEEVSGLTSPYVIWREKRKEENVSYEMTPKEIDGYNSNYQLEQAKRILFEILRYQFKEKYKKFREPTSIYTQILSASEDFMEEILDSEVRRLQRLNDNFYLFINT